MTKCRIRGVYDRFGHVPHDVELWEDTYYDNLHDMRREEEFIAEEERRLNDDAKRMEEDVDMDKNLLQDRVVHEEN